MEIIRRIVLTLIIVFAISPLPVRASVTPEGAAGGVVPQVGVWEGMTAQGYPISFYVSAGGSIFEPDAYGVDYECPTSGPQVWGLAFALIEVPIVEARFEFVYDVDPPRQITPGSRFALRWRGQFTSPAECMGTLDNGISVFTGDLAGTESCPLPAITWTASWIGPASPAELEEYRSRESDRIGPVSGSPAEVSHEADSTPRVASNDVDEPAGRVVPRDGYWSGTSSQGLFLEFSVADNGSTFLPEEFDVFITCPSSPYQSWGFGYTLLEVPIESGRFEFLFNLDSPNQITPGQSIVNRWRGEFVTETFCTGTMDAGISVFTGGGLATEACLERELTWTATWQHPADD